MRKTGPASVKVTLRMFRPSDARSLFALIRKTLLTTNAKYYPKRFITQAIECRRPAELKKEARKKSVFVARVGDRIVGTAKLSQKGWLGSLFVHPDFHHAGIGTKLVRHVLRTAKRRKLKQVRGHSTLNAVGFYRKLGFKIGRKYAPKDRATIFRITYLLN